MLHELLCLEPAAPARLSVRAAPPPRPGAHEVLVRMEASSVNPIDAKRAAGYGRRLLGLKGAARFPVILGNDVVGVVEGVGRDVTLFRPGQRVFGLRATGGARGAHASHVLVKQHLLRVAPAGVDAAALAVLPYSFTTVWLAMQAAGLNATNAPGARVLVHGASGGLGQLALQQLQYWGSDVTAVCGLGKCEAAQALGARVAVERGSLSIESLPADFDVVLNFANWDDEERLADRLGQQALGHATTVHPLLGNFDRSGWIGGALATARDKRRVRTLVQSRAPQARYAWTIFKPDSEALDSLADGVNSGRLALPVGIAVPLNRAAAAFEHVSSGSFGRAVLLP